MYRLLPEPSIKERGTNLKLNLDCVRSILLCVEENTGLRNYCFFIDASLEKSQLIIGDNPISPASYQADLLKKYSNDELIYHINYCIEADLLSPGGPQGVYQIFIAKLTPKGHDFLENIRDNKVWAGVKSVSTKIGSKSLEAVIQIASNVISGLIKSQFES